MDVDKRIAEAIMEREKKVFMLAAKQHARSGIATDSSVKEQNVPESLTDEANTERRLLSLKVDEISFSPFQTRESFDEEELLNLARSIQAKGVLQPVIVRELESSEGKEIIYELVAGERRLRAAKIAGLQEIPALVQKLQGRDAAEIGIIENAQRENLNAIEEALAYRRLVEDFRLSQSEIASVIGKNRTTIANALRLLQLEPRVIDILRQGGLSAGHGRALLMLPDQKLQYRLAKFALKHELSVRAVESMASRLLQRSKEGKVEASDQYAKEKALLVKQQTKIGELLGLERVELKLNQQGERRLSITFDSDASWRRFMSKLK